MRICSVGILLAVVCLVSGCVDPNAWPQAFTFGDMPILVSGPDVRLVTERNRPMMNSPALPTVCTEPSPDVAVAFGRSLAAQASVSEQNKFSGSGSISATSTEQVTALAGRTAGVLALRDGLYAACQAYTNGTLGQNAYAMVLSQYGNLLVALAAPSADNGSGSASGGGSSGGSKTNAALFSPKDATLAALLVSCISEYDPTRLGARKVNGSVAHNEMLTPTFCRNFLANVASGKLLQTPSNGGGQQKPAPSPGKQAATATQSVTIKVTGPSNAGNSGSIAASPSTSTTTPATTPGAKPNP
jgi:hypothetical protein